MNNQPDNLSNNTEQTYNNIRTSIIAAQKKVYTAVNSAMVLAYHEIGEQIYKACGENERAEYGAYFLQFISKRLTAEFGKGYTVANLRNMRQFYLSNQMLQLLVFVVDMISYATLVYLIVFEQILGSTRILTENKISLFQYSKSPEGDIFHIPYGGRYQKQFHPINDLTHPNLGGR